MNNDKKQEELESKKKELEKKKKEEEELDEELKQTFPASDPLSHSRTDD